MRIKRNKLQQRRSEEKKQNKINKDNYDNNLESFYAYSQEVYNEAVQLMKLNSYKRMYKRDDSNEEE